MYGYELVMGLLSKRFLTFPFDFGPFGQSMGGRWWPQGGPCCWEKPSDDWKKHHFICRVHKSSPIGSWVCDSSTRVGILFGNFT